MTRLALVCKAVAFTLCFVSGVYAEDAPKNESLPGIEVGAKAPGFALKDQQGHARKLADFIKPGRSVALVFYRSADW